MSGAAADGIDDRDLPKLELLNAAFHGDIEKIDALIREKQVPVDSADDDDVTALHIAAAMGNNNLVLKLLDHNANIDACNQLGMTAYHYAAREGKLAVIDTLLQRGANHQQKTSLGVTALTLACAGGHVDVVRRLLSFRYDTQRPETPKRTLAPTPLIVATYSKSPQICNYLARAGVPLDENIDILKGLSALSIAIICTKGVYMVRTLLDLGASATKRGFHRISPEELAKEVKRKDLVNLFTDKRNYRSRLEALSDVRREIKNDQIVERELGPPAQNGCTLLMYATTVKSINSAKFLILHRESDVNQCDNLNITALQVACLLRRDDIIQLLLQKGADITAANRFGLTAYDLFLQSCESIDPGSLRPLLHPHRPAEMKLNLGSSSSNIFKSFPTKTNIFTKVSSQILMTPPKTEEIEPQQWLEAKIKYQPAKDRNTYKFASVEEILRSVKHAKSPETNEYDMETEAMRELMEESQSFLVHCFTDFYGEREKPVAMPKYYDVAQENALNSGYHRKYAASSSDEVRRLPIIRPRKDSIEREYRKPRNISVMDSSSQNQMRTTPRMLKKSRGDMEYYSAQAGRARAPSNSMQVPTVVVRPRPVTSSVTTDIIWAHLTHRGQHKLMEALMREEIDRHSFFMLREKHLKEMGIYTPENQRVIEEVQHALLNGSN
uniref:ANK_REP_REGION domain-containing protein n=1 Tax=Caenorhabditis japonica TaxID=281687 RepID=A0A8R1HPJ7_CAEJA